MLPHHAVFLKHNASIRYLTAGMHELYNLAVSIPDRRNAQSVQLAVCPLSLETVAGNKHALDTV